MGINKDLLAFCGLYCGDCPAYKGEIAGLSVNLRQKLKEQNFDQVSQVLSEAEKGYKHYPQFSEVLDLLVNLRCKKTCRERVEPTSCQMRGCCLEKGIQGCWECEEFETCTKLDSLKPLRRDAHIQNLRKIKKKGVDDFLKGKRHW